MKEFSNTSLIIPVYNEEKNILNLFMEISNLKLDKYLNKIIIINDGSNDNSFLEINKIVKKYNNVNLLNNKFNKGQSYSIWKGINFSDDKNIILIDADGQNDPKDIFKIAKLYFENHKIKLVGGIRKQRKDNYIKRISSKIANFIRKIILKDNCDDTGCSLKIFERDIFLQYPFFDGIHRFIPALFLRSGNQTYFTEVHHRKRVNGFSKYGTFSRLINGIRDLIKVVIIIQTFKKK
tara:strand:- start:26 stop:733 length:708 start_codon:yes stop_codon:yes gene_type:complete